ncbi:MAG: zincin-like metallopeptidase domain-containing protein [Verrucomicrobiaceae bacterium]
MSTNEQRKDPYQAVTDLIIEHLERGTVPWRCPWQRDVGIPRNFHSGRAYNGINVLLLGLRHRPSPWWMTFQQAQERGGHVRKGEKGATVVKFGQSKPQALLTAPQAEGEAKESDAKPRKKMFLREYTVFNASQIDGIEFPSVTPAEVRNKDERIAAAEAIMSAMPNAPSIHEGARTVACYRPVTDTVQMPPYGSFENAEAYYLTLFHELVHATGHPSRLNRDSLTKHDEFGGPVYSQEELVAEMGAAFLGLEADIVRDSHEQSAAYLQSWLDVLRVKEHKRWIINAAAQATKATDYILNRKREPEPLASASMMTITT